MKQIYIASMLFLASHLSLNAQVTILLSNANTKGGTQGATSRVVFANSISGSTGQVGFSDGTVGGTVLMPTSTATVTFSNRIQSGAFNGHFFIPLTDPLHGTELWLSDATIAGTHMLLDINTGTGSSNPYGGGNGRFPIVGQTMFFAADDGVHGSELWKTDGTAAGTVLVKDINPGTAGSNIMFSNYTGNNFVGDTLYFTANDGTHGQELWRTDGTTAGTALVADISPGNASTTFGSQFTGLNHILYFQADDNVNGAEPWRTDGTVAGTFMLKDVNPGSGGSFDIVNSNNFNSLIFNNNFYFVADSKFNSNQSNNPQIYTTDGTTAGTVAITNNNPNKGGLNASLNQGGGTGAVILNGKFYFTTNFDSYSVSSIWSSDGTAANTKLFKIIYPNPGPGGNLNPFLNMLLPTFANTDSSIQKPFQGNKFFFEGDDGTHGLQLWVSDGTVANTKMLTLNPTGNGIDTTNGQNSVHTYFTQDHLFLTATDGTHGYEPWQSDGTQAGTVMVDDIWPGNGSSSADFMGVAGGNTLVFFADDGTGINIYKLNATVITLPVLMGNFTAQLSGKSVLVNWNTVQEVNTAKFNIQRSTDDLSFVNIGAVEAAGNSSQPKYYSYTDGTIFNTPVDEYFYRLQIVGKDGNVSYSKIAPVVIQQNTAFKILPNPVANKLVISFDNTVNGKAFIKIISSAGQLVVSRQLDNVAGQTIILPLNVATGAYFVEVQAGKNKWQKTIIKQ